MKRVMIEMLKDADGQDVNDSGIAQQVRKYMSGQKYEVGESLVKSFLSMEVAIRCDEKPKPEPKPKKKEAKKPKPAPKKEKKIKRGAPENKAKK